MKVLATYILIRNYPEITGFDILSAIGWSDIVSALCKLVMFVKYVVRIYAESHFRMIS